MCEYACAELIAAPQEICIHMPEGLSYEQAAGLPEVARPISHTGKVVSAYGAYRIVNPRLWMTATQALWQVGDFKPGEPRSPECSPPSISNWCIPSICELEYFVNYPTNFQLIFFFLLYQNTHRLYLSTPRNSGSIMLLLPLPIPAVPRPLLPSHPCSLICGCSLDA